MKATAIKAPIVNLECLGASVTLALHEDDHISRQLVERHSFYEEELLLDLYSLERKGTYVDVGANIGNHTLFFAKVMGQRVFAFEPFPANLKILKRNVELNGLSKLVRVEGKAVSAVAGQGNLENPNAANFGMVRLAETGLPCKVVALDDVLAKEDVAVLKVDVEGHEYDVLLGARETIRRARPYIVFEASSLEEHERVAALIKPLGYVYTRSYSATPTHLYVHEEHLSLPRRLGLLLGGIDYMLERRFRGVKTADNSISVNLKETLKQVTEIASGAEALKAELRPISALLPTMANRSDLDSFDQSLKKMEAGLHSRLKSINDLYADISPALEQLSRKLSASLADRERDAKLLESLLQQTQALPETITQFASLERLLPEMEELHSAIAEIGNSLSSAIKESRVSDQESATQLKSAIEGLSGFLARLERSATEQASTVKKYDRELAKELRGRTDILKHQLGRLSEQGQRLEKHIDTAGTGISRAVEQVYEQLSSEAESGFSDLKQCMEKLQASIGELGESIESWRAETRSLLTPELGRMNESIQRLSDTVVEMDIRAIRMEKTLENASRDSAAVLEHLQALKSQLVTKDEASTTVQAMENRLNEKFHELVERSEKAAREVQASIRYREVVERQKIAVTQDAVRQEPEVESRKSVSERFRAFMQKRRDRAAIERILYKAWSKAAPVRALRGTWDSSGTEGGNCNRSWTIGEGSATLRIEFRPEGVRRFAKLVLPKAGGSALKLAGQRAEASNGTVSEGAWKKTGAASRFSLKGTIPARCKAVELDFVSTDSELDIRKLVSRLELSPSYRAGSKSRPLVTVVVTAFNAANTIQKSLESLLVQTWQNLEIIVVDDCSTDSTCSIVERLAARDSRVRLLPMTNNMGTYCAKNMAVYLARGEFLTFQDSDDVSVPTRIEDQVKALMKSPDSAVCFCKYVRLDEKSELVMNRGLPARRAVMCPLWRRSKFLEVGFFDPVRGGADAEFIARAKRILGPAALKDINSETYYAYHREGSLSRTQAGVDISNETLEEALGDQRARYQQNFEAFYSDPAKAVYRRHLNAGIRQYDAPPGVIGKNHGMAAPVVAALATIPERESSFRKTFATLIDQVDFLCVYLNNFDSVPDFLRHDRVIVERSQNFGDLKDTGKFFFIDRFPDAYYFTVDDDILYPPDYVSAMLFRSFMFGKGVILGVHGVNFKSGFQRFSTDREVFSFRHENTANRIVDLLGTGTMMFVPAAVRISVADIRSNGMADIWVCIAAKERRLPMICVSRPHGWLKDAEAQTSSLWTQTVANDRPHTNAIIGSGAWGLERRKELQADLARLHRRDVGSFQLALLN